jgi:S1-C subfamily serine protease
VADALGLDRIAGAVVARVSDKGPAASAGLVAGDVIVNIDGFEVGDARAVQYRLTTRGIGSTVKVGVIRKGQPQTIDLTLVAAPQPGRDDVRNLAGQHPLDGARVSNILAGVADELGIDEADGVVVLSVRRASTAARLGFQPGDVIVEVNQHKVETVSDLDGVLGARQRMWLVAVRRGDKVFNLQVPG